MSGGKEIRTKIKSVQNTQKITKAMEMVAASKMRKAQDRMQAARPYADKIQRVIMHLAQAKNEYKHPFTLERDAKRVGYILVSTDRGLCGGLNVNMFRAAIHAMENDRKQGLEIDLSIIGAKAMGFFRRLGMNVVSEATHLGDRPELTDLIGAIKIMLDAYDEARIDRLYMVYNEFVNTMTQKPSVVQLLPLPPSDEEELSRHWDYLYEPDAKEVLDTLLDRYIESLIYRAVVENIACEQAARMVAMKSA
ncbi:MAG: F0F1 ATP synthase subunit gamma, partial [Gammaproteobacteria bacterium]|nr:F0F1 ATP synthase subunit gamma [Gammaproteobacteria bacterium]